MLKDLRHGVRMLVQARGWTIVVVLSLALGIGANTALFSAVNGLLVNELPVSHPGALVRLRSAGPNHMRTSSSDYGFMERDSSGLDQRATFSYPMYQQFLADNRTMIDLAACAPYGRVNLVADGHADTATAFISSGNYFQMLGVSANPGRTITTDDDKPTAPAVTVISERFWRSRFGGNPEIVGKTVQINNVPITIVGVLPASFTGVQQVVAEPPDVSLPLALESQLSTERARLNEPTYWWLQVMGRLKPETTAAQVQGNLEGVFQHTARAGLDSYLASLSEAERSVSSNQNRTAVPHLRVTSGSRGVYDVGPTETRAVTILGVVVALVLLIVCANVANLLLSRAAARQKEISVRLSLGATRGRLIRQLLTESLLLAALGGSLGVLVGYWGRAWLPGLPGRTAPLDWHVVAFVVGVTSFTGLLFGIAPALRATRFDVSGALKETGRSVVGTRSRLGKVLLVVQVTISLVLLIGAGLFLRTVQNLREVNVGFNPHNLAMFRVNPQLNRYDAKRAVILYEQMIERLQAVPGVRAAGLSQPGLLSGGVSSTSIYVQGRAYAQGQSESINRLVVSPNFFEMMEIPLLLGRGFTGRDRDGAPKVVVINNAAATKYFPNENPIGRRFGTSRETTGNFEVVGVLRDAKYSSVRDPAPPTMYVPFQQTGAGTAVFVVRTAGDPMTAIGSIREAVKQIDPNLPLMDPSTQMEQVERRFAQEKMFAQAYALFGGIALLLAAIGLFGLMSYSVARRTNEIGIRMALGAQRGHVLRLVMRESMLLVVAGVVVGLAIALAAGRLVASLLFGLTPTDAPTMMLAVSMMLLVSAVAGFLPARRASRVDPMVALHYE